jgi:Na+-driven multidrug efflux pump
MTFTRLFSTALLGINNLKGFFFSYGFQYLIIIFLDLVLITKSIGNLGSLGAVISQLIASVIGILISHFYLRKEFEYKQKYSNYLFWLYACISIISTYFIVQLDFFDYIASNFILQSLTLIALGLGIYFVISLSTKLITPQDLVLILKIINPKELTKFVLNEIKDRNTKSKNEIGFE